MAAGIGVAEIGEEIARTAGRPRDSWVPISRTLRGLPPLQGRAGWGKAAFRPASALRATPPRSGFARVGPPLIGWWARSPAPAPLVRAGLPPRRGRSEAEVPAPRRRRCPSSLAMTRIIVGNM